MGIFDTIKKTKGWREDPTLSFNDNLFFGSIHFCKVFFGKYRVVRHNNDDFDDLASDCSLAVYEAAKRNLDKWDREKYRMDQYLYGRAWSTVGNWLKQRYMRKQRELVDVRTSDNDRLTPRDYDVGLDELDSNNYEQGTRYTVWMTAPLSYYERKLSDAARDFLDYKDECEYMGIEPVDPEDFLTNKNSKETDLKYLGKILNEENPNPRVTKKEVRVSLGKVKHSS